MALASTTIAPVAATAAKSTAQESQGLSVNSPRRRIMDPPVGLTRRPDPVPLTTPNSRYLLWLANYDGATLQSVETAVGKYAVAVFNADRRDLALRLRRADPQVRILVYLDAASVRTYDGATPIAAGVSYAEALSRGWLARDNAGSIIEWPYPGHLQTTVWDQAYQRAWTNHAASLASEDPWDGILMDNDLTTLHHYSPQLLAGTSTQDETDRKLRNGLDSLLGMAGARLNAIGKEFVPNISDGRLDPARWKRRVIYGGGMEENFMAWTGQVGAPTIHNWGPTGWSTVIEQISTPGRTLAMTNVASTDVRTQLYAYASFLMRAEPGDAWQARTPALAPALPAETSITLGLPTGAMTRVGSAYFRAFEGGWAAVNPSLSTQVVSVPNDIRDFHGQPMSEVTLGPMTGMVGRRLSSRAIYRPKTGATDIRLNRQRR